MFKIITALFDRVKKSFNEELLYISRPVPIVTAARSGTAPYNAPDRPNVPKLEAEIDPMVYKLYGLTAAEIAIVERK